MNPLEGLKKLRVIPDALRRRVNRHIIPHAHFTSVKDGTSIMATRFSPEILRLSGEDRKLAIHILDFEPQNKQGVEPGLYCQTGATCEEWNQTQSGLRFLHGAKIIQALKKSGRLAEDQYITGSPKYLDSQGHILLKIELIE